MQYCELEFILCLLKVHAFYHKDIQNVFFVSCCFCLCQCPEFILDTVDNFNISLVL